MLRDVLEVVSTHMYAGKPGGGAVAALGDGSTDSLRDAPAVGATVGGLECVLSQSCEPRAELARFKRSMATVGKFAHSLHEVAGAPVRGAQAHAQALQRAGERALNQAERR